LCKVPRCRYVKFESPRMAPLPTIRMDNPSPWRNVGIDYLGPLHCKHLCEEAFSNRCPHPPTFKVWLALFTCLHTRAIHVEIIESCSTREFLQTLRRFVGRYGKPTIIYSDNARHFVAANKQLQTLKNLDFNQIQGERYSGEYIEWKFSTPEAPWTNGVTERMVAIFKKQLKILLQKNKLLLNELQTIISELTGAINDRPLGTTQDGELYISPNMLQYGRNLNAITTPSNKEIRNVSCSDMWITRKRILNSFWFTWRKQYLQELSIPSKWINDTAHKKIISPGDVVLLKADTLEKNQWRIGRVVEIHEYNQGNALSLSVKLPLSNTVVIRSIRQVALLESSQIFSETGNKSKDLGNPDLDSGCCGSGRRTLKVTQSKGLIISERGTGRSPVESDPVQDSGEGGTIDTDPGKETLTATSESVFLPPKCLKDTQANPRCLAEIQGKTDDATCKDYIGSGRKRQRQGYYRSLNAGKL
ncbi:Uncharacterized protein FKW44_014566, partial [Caligus rogercresseyi]